MFYPISTPCGIIRGTASRHPGVVAYKGIPYAQAERWTYPTETRHWDGILDATEYGPACVQQRAYKAEVDSRNPFYYYEFRKGVTFTYEENCLCLNIFTPEQAKNAPVIVYIHGGAFLGGSSDELCFDEPDWPKHGVVAVTLNYRLGPFGYACFEELAEREGQTGNYGLYDQLTALKWIKTNISSYGGDPENVTLMGQSAGAVSVQHLISSPLARGLIHRAIMASGGGRGRMFGPTVAAEDRFFLGRDLLKALDCRRVDELRTIPPKLIIDAYDSLLQSDFHKYWGSCSIVVDHIAVMPSINEIESGEQLDIPYMIGSTSEDLDPSMILDAQEWSVMQGKPSFSYFFERKLPGDEKGAFHSADLWYWFGTLDRCWRPFIERDFELSSQMKQYLINFARTGNPNSEDLPLWESGEMGRTLCFGQEETAMIPLVVEASHP